MGRTGTAAAFLGGRDGSFFFLKKKQPEIGYLPGKKKKIKHIFRRILAVEVGM